MTPQMIVGLVMGVLSLFSFVLTFNLEGYNFKDALAKCLLAFCLLVAGSIWLAIGFGKITLTF